MPGRMVGKGRCSFLKKRTKKLLFTWLARLATGRIAGRQIDKSFLLLFFKKEVLPYLLTSSN